MTKEDVREKLLEMKEQYIFEVTGEKAKKKTYSVFCNFFYILP